VKHQAGSEIPLTPEGIVEAVHAVAEEMGIVQPSLDPLRAAALARLAQESAAGVRVGLTNYEDVTEVLNGLLLPALAAFRWLKTKESLEIVEIGAGGGGIGLTLALLAPDWRVTLVDRREKAVTFMEIIVTRLNLLNAHPVAGDMRKRSPEAERYDAALFRAVGSPAEDLDIAEDWVKPGGLSLIWTSANAAIPTDSALWSHVGTVAARKGRMAVLAFCKA
jgi:predicted O-methyltransferase YrrM